MSKIGVKTGVKRIYRGGNSPSWWSFQRRGRAIYRGRGRSLLLRKDGVIWTANGPLEIVIDYTPSTTYRWRPGGRKSFCPGCLKTWACQDAEIACPNCGDTGMVLISKNVRVPRLSASKYRWKKFCDFMGFSDEIRAKVLS